MHVLKVCNRQNIRLHPAPHSVPAFAKNNIVSESSTIKILTSVPSGDASLQPNYWTQNKENVPPISRYVPEATKGIQSVSISVKDLEELSEVIGDMVMNEFGFSYIMNLLSRRNGHFRRCLYESIFSRRIFTIVSNNCYGHHIVELLVANANAPEQQLIANTLRGHMVEFASSRFTSRVVQSAFWKLGLPICSTLLAELRGCGHYLATNSYGSHVLEVIFSRMRPLHYGFIIDEIVSSPVVIVDVACSKYGCRVLESAIQVLFGGAKENRSSIADDCLNKLLKAIVDACCLNFVADEYGNFVVQKILAYKQFAEYADAIIADIISRNVLVLSQTKHGSHVIQAVLRNASPKSLRLIMREIFDGYYFDAHGRDALDVLMMDGYGNYVVQTMLDVSIAVNERKRDGLSEWFERLAGRIIRAKDSIIHLSSGKKLVGTLNQVLGTVCEPMTQRVARPESEVRHDAL